MCIYLYPLNSLLVMVSEDWTEEEGSELGGGGQSWSATEGPGSPVLGSPELLSQVVVCQVVQGMSAVPF